MCFETTLHTSATGLNAPVNTFCIYYLGRISKYYYHFLFLFGFSNRSYNQLTPRQISHQSNVCHSEDVLCLEACAAYIQHNEATEFPPHPPERNERLLSHYQPDITCFSTHLNERKLVCKACGLTLLKTNDARTTAQHSSRSCLSNK